jgi:tRNA-specific 2-thiouridylase
VLLVVQGKDHPRLYQQELYCAQLHWISDESPVLPYTCQAKTRYQHDDNNINCTIQTQQNGQHHVIFEMPQRCVTPGQSIVFYQNEVCLGGGIISGGKIQ